jgi:hypothetical protein
MAKSALPESSEVGSKFKAGLRFSRYHAAGFGLPIGADGLNGLAPEVK